MNIMAIAHKNTKALIRQLDYVSLSYKDVFQAQLKAAHAQAKKAISFVVNEFPHSRAYIPSKELTFKSYDQAKAYVDTLPMFACAAISAPNHGGVCFTNYPNPYNPSERKAADAFDKKDAGWKAYVNKW